MRHMKFICEETTRHGEKVVYFRRGKGARVRLPEDTSAPEFREAYFAAIRGEAVEHEPIGLFQRRDARLRSIFSDLIRGCRGRASQRGTGFNISVEWLVELTKQQQYRCAVTGIALDLKERSRRGNRNPYAPSVDRIDSKGGYTEDNVRVVAYAVNIMLADWGEDVLARVAEAYNQNKSGAPMPAPRNTPPRTLKNSEA